MSPRLEQSESFISWDRCYDFEDILSKIGAKIGEFDTNYRFSGMTTLVSKKNANYCAKNVRKSPKIVIVTLTPCLLM
jgi:hypothetical protein